MGAEIGMLVVETIAKISLLSASAHIIHALAAELRVSRTMDGAAIDDCIRNVVALKSIELERERRAAWRERELNAAAFLKGLETSLSGDSIW
jgi:hypothetical protein